MQIYLNKWYDRESREVFIDQYTFKPLVGVGAEIEQAIDEYELLNGGRHFSYIETIFIDTDAGVSKIIDIVKEIELRQTESEKRYNREREKDDE